jgi:hypothetical protein
VGFADHWLRVTVAAECVCAYDYMHGAAGADSLCHKAEPESSVYAPCFLFRLPGCLVLSKCQCTSAPPVSLSESARQDLGKSEYSTHKHCLLDSFSAEDIGVPHFRSCPRSFGSKDFHRSQNDGMGSE